MACAQAAQAAQAVLGAAGPTWDREVRGTISHVTDRGARPLSGAWVTLHRVGTDNAGPVDSARTGENGRYDFRYHATGDTSALYFVSSRFAGIAYFTPPLKERLVTGTAADLIVYDTTSAPVTKTMAAAANGAQIPMPTTIAPRIGPMIPAPYSGR